jgi:methyl-accepting chemotaxis protein
VVADEVRALAQKSAAAAQITSNLILESTRNVQAGVRLTEVVQTKLTGVSGDVQQVVDSIRQIADASEEQSTRIAQLTRAIDTVSRTTQAGAATTEETAAATQDMARQAEVMAELVAHFNTGEQGAGTVPSVPLAEHAAGAVALDTQGNTLSDEPAQFIEF